MTKVHICSITQQEYCSLKSSKHSIPTILKEQLHEKFCKKTVIQQTFIHIRNPYAMNQKYGLESKFF